LTNRLNFIPFYDVKAMSPNSSCSTLRKVDTVDSQNEP